VADKTTGSTLITNEAAVNVTAATEVAPGRTIIGYAITEAEEAPDPIAGTWLVGQPTEYTILGAPGDVSLWFWIRDSLNQVAGRACTIRYTPAAPAVLTIHAYGQTTNSAIVAWTTNTACHGKLFWREQGTETWSESPLEDRLLTNHWRVMNGLAFDLTYEYYVQSNESDDAIRLYTHESTIPEIPKPAAGGVMTADADQSDGANTADKAIDSNDSDTSWCPGWGDMRPHWLRIDLKSRYRVQRVSVAGEKNDHGLKDYQIFIETVASLQSLSK